MSYFVKCKNFHKCHQIVERQKIHDGARCFECRTKEMRVCARLHRKPVTKRHKNTRLSSQTLSGRKKLSKTLKYSSEQIGELRRACRGLKIK